LLGMLFGSVVTLAFSALRIKKKLNLWIFNGLIGLIVLIGAPAMVIGVLRLNIYIRVIAFAIFLIVFWLISKKYDVININEILRNSFSKVRYSLIKK